MKQLLFVLFLIFSIKSYSQISKVNLELNYPIPVDDNFIGSFYTGIIDLGTDFRFANLNPVNIGVSFNGGLLINNSDLINKSHVKNYILQPRVFGEVNLESIPKFHPQLGIGYTVMVIDPSGNEYDVLYYSGFNLNLGIAYDLTKKLFTQVQYDFIKLGVADDVMDVKFNTNVNILKVGIGYRI